MLSSTVRQGSRRWKTVAYKQPDWFEGINDNCVTALMVTVSPERTTQ
jgi:hypothetical protein